MKRCNLSTHTSVVATILFLATVAPAAADATAEPKVLSRDSRGVPTWVSGDLGKLPKGSLERSAEKSGHSAVSTFAEAFARRSLGGRGSELMVVRRRTDDEEAGLVHFRLRQYIRGLPVLGADMALHVDAATHQVRTVNGRFVPDVALARRPLLDAEVALERASFAAEISSGEALEVPELAYVIGHDDQVYLAWNVRVRYPTPEGEQIDRIFADAMTGDMVANHPQTHSARNRRTHTANNGTNLPGNLLISEGGTSGDAVAQTAHDHSGRVYDYYNNVHGRDSLNGSGMEIRTTVHFGNNVVNAQWTGSQMWYGDGDGVDSGPLGNALDIVAHEMTHGVTDFESNLIYANESGALNESMSDVFGAAVEAWADSGVSSDTWKLGEDTWISDDALRFMNDPALDGSSRDWYPDRFPFTFNPNNGNDFGGVHSNSGISNLAFYLLSQGGSHPRGKSTRAVPSIGISDARQIYYRANRDYLTASSNFSAMRNSTVQAAKDLFGSSSPEASAVHTAWCAVGVPGCLSVNISAPQSQCSPANITVSSSRSILGGCQINSCSYSWSVRECMLNGCNGFSPLSGSGSSVTYLVDSDIDFVEFKVVANCNTNCGQIQATDSQLLYGPVAGICGGPADE